jgi:selenium metabolism protein YedF
MKEKMDLRGLLCPEPVIATKKMLDSKDTDAVEVLVDDEVCAANLQRLARSLGASCAVEQLTGFFQVTISRAAVESNHVHQSESNHVHQSESVSPALAGAMSAQAAKDLKSVVFITREQFGQGDPEFSRTLSNVFLQTLYEAGHRPRAILMANSGVKLMAAGSSARKVLQDFSEAGSEVFCCGLCVEYYGLGSDVPKEQIINMFAICEYLAVAEKVIQF